MTCGPSRISRASRGSEKLLTQEGPQGAILCPLDFPVEPWPARTPFGQLLHLGHQAAERKEALGSPHHHGWSLWPGQVSLLTPTALPLPSPLTAGGEVLISPGPDTRQTLNEWPLFLSGGVVGPARSECPQEPGSPGEGKGTEQWEHTVLLRKK